MWKDRALSLFQNGWDHLLGYSNSPKTAQYFNLTSNRQQMRPSSLSLLCSGESCAIWLTREKKLTQQTTGNQQSSLEKGSLLTMKLNIFSKKDIQCIAKIFPAVCCLTTLFLVSDTRTDKNSSFSSVSINQISNIFDSSFQPHKIF